MAENEFQDINQMRQSIHAGLNPEEVVWRGEDGSRATDVDRGHFTLYGEDEVKAFDYMVEQRQGQSERKETAPDVNVPAKEDEGFFDDYKNSQLNAWKKFYSQEEDTLIEAKKLSEKTGIPENIILTNDDTIDRVREIAKSQEKNLDMAQVFKENPALAALAKDGNDTLAAVAMYHLPEVKEQKTLIETFKNGLRAAEIQAELNVMGDIERSGGAKIDEERVKKLQEEYTKVKAPSFDEDSIGAVVGGTVEQLPQMFRGGLKAIERGTQMGAAGAMMGFATGTALGGVGAVPGAFTGALSGFSLGARYGYFEGSYNEMAGSNYLQLRMEKDKYGNPKWTKDQANALAVAQATFSAGIETWEAGTIINRLAGGKGAFVSELKDIVKNSSSKESGIAALGIWLKNNMVAAAKTTLEESLEEGVQSISDDTIYNMFAGVYGKEGISVAEMYQNAKENFTEALAPSAGFGGLQFAASLGGATTRRIARGLQIKSDYQLKMEKTKQGIELLTQVKEMMGKSEYAKKDAAGARETLAKNIEGSGFENVYIDTETMRQNGDTELLTQVVNVLNVSDEEKQSILNGESDINGPVSFSQMATPSIGDKVNQYISFDETSMSFAKNKRYAEVEKKILEEITKFDTKQYDDIIDIIVNADFSEEQREMARELISKHGIFEAKKKINADLKGVTNSVNEIIMRNGPNTNEGYTEGDMFSYLVPGKGYGYFTDTDNRIVMEDELGADVKGEMRTRWEWHPVKKEKVEPQWKKALRDSLGGHYSKAAERQLIVDSILGNNNGNIWDYAPETLESDRVILPKLLAEQERLQKLKDGFKNLDNKTDEIARGLSKEGYEAYKQIAAAIRQSDNAAVRQAAKADAVLLARHADRVAEIIRQTGKEYTALDYLKDFVELEANGKDGKTGEKGRIEVSANNQVLIKMFEAADQSTFAHESAHLFLRDLELLAKLENAPEQVVKDYKAVMAWAEYNSSQLKEYSGLATYEEFARRDEEIKYAQKHGGFVMRRSADGKYETKVTLEQLKEEWKQERFARGWEQYLRDGKAPTSSLQRIYRAFKEWLTSIYKDYIAVGPQPSLEVKAVMDRMVATAEEIDIQEKRSGYNSFVRAGGLNFLAKDSQAMFEKFWTEAKAEAKERVLKEAINDSKAAFAAEERKKEEERIRPQIEYEARDNPVLAIDEMLGQGDDMGLEGLCEMAGMTVEEYKKQLASLGGSFEDYVNNKVKEHMEQYVNPPVVFENIKANAQRAISRGEYADKLAEYEVLAMVQKGQIEQRIGKMADKKFAEIEKALSGIDANENVNDNINELQRKINDLKYTIRWNEAETKLLLKIEEGVGEAKLAFEKEKAKAKVEKLREKIKTLRENIKAFRAKIREQREGIRIVRDAEKGWISEARAFINGEFADTMSLKEYGSEGYNQRRAKEHRNESAYRMGKGEWEAAALAKREEVYSNLKAALARKTQKKIDTIKINLGKKLKTLKKQDHVAANQRYMFHTMLMAFGLTPEVELRVPADFPGALEELKVMQENGYIMQFESTGLNTPPMWLLNALDGQKLDLKELTGAELRDFDNFMKMLYKSGSKQMVLDKDGNKIELNESCVKIRQESNARMAKIQDVSKGKAHQNETKRQHFARLARKGNANILQTETVLEMMGPLAHNLVYQRITDAAMNELRALGAMTKRLQKLMDDTLGVNSEKFLKGKYRFGDELLDGSELLTIALNCGTQTNKRRIFSSFNVTEEQLQQALSELGEKEWQFVEGVWGMFEEIWPQYADVQIAITGGMAKKEQAYGFYIKGKDGTMRYIKGGYYPITYDSRQGTKARQLENINNVKAASMGPMSKNVGTGSTNERAKEVTDMVLSTKLERVSSMLTEHIHFINMRQAYLDARAVVNNKEFKSAVIEQFGSDMQAVMEEWVESQWADPRPSNAIVDQAGRWARTSLTLGALSFRLTTALINVANIATVSLYLGPTNAVRALRSFYKIDGKIGQRWSEVLSKSVFLAQRAEVFDANIRENVKKRVGVSKLDRSIQKFNDLMMLGFKPIMLTDLILAIPTWQHEYERVYREANPMKQTPEQIEADAIRAGDKAVRKCFGSGMKQDITAVQRGPEYTKMLTTFYSYFAVVHNLVASKVAEGRRAEYQGKGAVAKWAPIANAVLFEYIIQSVIDSAVRQMASMASGDEWDWEKFGKKSVTNIADNMFGAIPGLRDFVPRFLETLMGERVQDVRIPLIDIGNKISKIAGDIKDDNKDKIDVAYDCMKLLSAISGASDPLLMSAPTIARFIDEYSKQNWQEFIAAIAFGRRIKSKE